jgi:hypothetical protein
VTSTGHRVAGFDLRPSAGVDLAIEVDVTDGDAVAGAVARVESELGPVEALVTARRCTARWSRS